MRFLMILVCFSVCVYFKGYNQSILELERCLFCVYKDDFEQFIEFDEKYNLIINDEKLYEYFVEKGYKVKISKSSDLNFKISFIINKNKPREYSFYLVKNYG